MFLSSSDKSIVGVDIGSSSIKLVGLTRTKRGYHLDSLAISGVPRDCVIDGEIYNIGAVSNVLKDLVKASKVRGQSAFTGIAGSGVMVKRVKIPLMPKNELDAHIRWEAEQYIPFDIDNVNLDYDIISTNFNKTGKMDLIIAAARKDQVSAYSAVVYDSGLITEGVDISSIAVYDMYKENYGDVKDESVIVLDIGASKTSVNVIEKNKIVFYKEIEIGGEYFTRRIQEQLNINFEEGETLKVSSDSGSLTPEVEKILLGEMKNLAIEIKKNIDLYTALSSNMPVGEISIMGGGAKIVGVSKIIESVTGIPTVTINPFKNIAFDEDLFPINYLEQVAPFFGVAIGIAIRGLRY
jgi:type IV pilus assembly protein PilM